MIISKCSKDGIDYFKVSCSDGADRIFTGKGLFIKERLDQMKEEGYKIPTYDYKQIEFNGQNIMSLPDEEFMQAQLVRAVNFEINAISPEEFASWLGLDDNTNIVAVKIPPREITIHSREEFLIHLELASVGNIETDFRPLNYFVADEALFSIDEILSNDDIRTKLGNLSMRRNFTLHDFNKMKDWLESKLNIQINTEKDFLEAYCAWGIDGIKTTELTLKNSASNISKYNPLEPASSDNIEYVSGCLDINNNLLIRGSRIKIDSIFDNTLEYKPDDLLDKKERLAESKKQFEVFNVARVKPMSVISFGYSTQSNRIRIAANVNNLFIESVSVTSVTSIQTKMFTFLSMYNTNISIDEMLDYNKYVKRCVAYNTARKIVDTAIVKPKYDNLKDIWMNECNMSELSAIRYLVRYLTKSKDEAPNAALNNYRKITPMTPSCITDAIKYGLEYVCENNEIDLVNIEVTDDFFTTLENIVTDTELQGLVSETMNGTAGEGEAEEDSKRKNMPRYVLCYNALNALYEFLDGSFDIGFLSEAKAEIDSGLKRELADGIYNVLLSIQTADSEDLQNKLNGIIDSIDLEKYTTINKTLLIAEQRDYMRCMNDMIYSAEKIIVPLVAVREPDLWTPAEDQEIIGYNTAVVDNVYFKKVLIQLGDMIRDTIVSINSEGRLKDIVNEGYYVRPFLVIISLLFDSNNVQFNDDGSATFKFIIEDTEFPITIPNNIVLQLINIGNNFDTTGTFISNYDLINRFVQEDGSIHWYPFGRRLSEHPKASESKYNSVNLMTLYYLPNELKEWYNYDIKEGEGFTDANGNPTRISDDDTRQYGITDALLEAKTNVYDIIAADNADFNLPIIIQAFSDLFNEGCYMPNKFDALAYFYDPNKPDVRQRDQSIMQCDAAFRVIYGNSEIKNIEGPISANTSKLNTIHGKIENCDIDIDDRIVNWYITTKPTIVLSNAITADDGSIINLLKMTLNDVRASKAFYQYHDKVLLATPKQIYVIEIRN